MANDSAPVCNLPNIGQVPALMPGRMYPSVPRAQDLPSLIAAVNQLAQIIPKLYVASLPTFQNNVGTVTIRDIVGTAGIVGGAGADGTTAQAGKDGKDGEKAKDAKYKESSRKTERVKVKGTEGNEECFLIMKRVTSLTMTSSADGKKKIEWQGNVGTSFGGPIEMGQPTPSMTDSEGREFKGTTKFNREVTEESTTFPSNGVNGCGFASRPFETGLMADCVGVSWAGGFGFLAVVPAGTYTSKDGEEWKKVGSGFAAKGVAYGRKVWVAVTQGGMRLSKDKGKTWKSVSGPPCQEIVFAGPSPKKDHKEENGAFYALDVDHAEGGGDVYSSTNGVSWSKCLSIPGFVDGPGIIGYTAEGLGTWGDEAVLVADQWTEVPSGPDQAGNYTRAAKYTGSGGSMGSPEVYGPEGNASTHGDASTNAGGGAAQSRNAAGEDGETFISYKITTGTGFGSAHDEIVMNGGAIATSNFSAGGGSRVSGGGNLSAAGGEAWGIGNEVDVASLNVDLFFLSSSGAKGSIGSGDASTSTFDFGRTAGLAVKDKAPVFAGFATAGGNGGIWSNAGGGWSVVISATAGAVGVGKIAIGKKQVNDS